MYYIIFVSILFFSLRFIQIPHSFGTIPHLPNIILIVADDLSPADVGAYGSIDSLTPNIDALAASGARMTRFYAQPACTPTRYELMTGNHVNKSYYSTLRRPIIWNEYDYGITQDEVTLPEILKQYGYDTAIIGKWHLGHGKEEFHPLNHGFDYFYGSLFGGLDYNTKMVRSAYYDWWENRTPSYDEGYITHLTTNKALEYVSKSRVNPYFLYLPYHAPHWAVINDTDPIARTQLPADESTYLSRFNKVSTHDIVRKRFLAMLSIMDDGIGAIMRATHGTNTIIVFVGDNGSEEAYGGSTGILRDDKGSMYEGGIRVPGIFNWRGRIEPQINAQLGRVQDLFPTLLSMIDAEPIAVDGLDISPSFYGAEIDRSIYMDNLTYGEVLIHGNFKYYQFKGVTEFYDLENDPGETKNIMVEQAALFDAIMGLRPNRMFFLPIVNRMNTHE